MLKAGNTEADLFLVTVTFAVLTVLSDPPDPLLAALTVGSLTALLLARIARRRRP